MENAITFGQWVKQRRKTLCLTQMELGGLISCSTITVKKIEADQRKPSVPVTMLLARYLKITPKERASFISLAHPDLSSEQINEISSPYAQPLNGSTKRRVSNLQTPPSPLIGRTQEVESICRLLTTPSVRILTLTGAGGIGKTSLSIQVANDLREQFAYGCWFISLATLTDPKLVVPTIARSLGIKESRDSALDEALLNYLADKDMLLVLDNFEQVLPAATQIAEILTCAPGIKLLITSRTVLHLLGEYEFVVSPLRLVDLHHSPSNKEIVDSPAVALFVQRAQVMDGDFMLTTDNTALVAKICAQLDGLPLAIELAAARIKVLRPAALLSRLEGSTPEGSHLNELADGAKNLPARQQTMRRTIDWSYNLLNESEQNLFRHLAVFAGGYTLEAAAAVCGDVSTEYPLFGPLAKHAFANKLAALVDQSMILQIKTPNEEPRFGMLESLREYALERLTARSKEWTTLKRRHAQYFVSLAKTAEPKFAGAEQSIWLDRLELEHDNLLAALAWSATSKEDAGLGLTLLGAGWQFWLIRGYVNEGRIWLKQFIETATTAPKLDRARALNGVGFLNWVWGDFLEAKQALTESLAIFREFDDPHGTAWALNHLGHIALTENDYALAYNLVTESLRLFRTLNADSHIAWDLLNLGDIVQAQGDETQAIAHYVEAQSLFRKVQDQRGLAWALDRLGQRAQARHDYEQASKLYTESISIFQQVNDKRSTAWVLNHLGKVALAQGDFEQSWLILEESLMLFREISWPLDGAWAAMEMGFAARELKNEVRAKTFFTKSLNLFREVDNQRGIAEALAHLEQLSHVHDADAAYYR